MKSVIVDANVLCLLIAGQFAPTAIGRHKRLKAFSIEDFDKVVEITSHFESAITCPNILTETSNLLASTNPTEAAALLNGLKSLLSVTTEHHTPSLVACDSLHYSRLGLTDAVLLTMIESDSVLLTVDLGLTLAAQQAGRTVINYNWIRDDAINKETLGF